MFRVSEFHHFSTCFISVSNFHYIDAGTTAYTLRTIFLRKNLALELDFYLQDFHIEGRYENQLLLLSPVAVRTDVQRQGISKALIEEGFRRMQAMGFRAVLVEGNPRNYNPRGFVTSADHGIVAGPNIHLPHVTCLMVKELAPGALEEMHGQVDYGFYDSLRED